MTSQQDTSFRMGALQRRLLRSSALGIALTVLIGAVAMFAIIRIQTRVEQQAIVLGPTVQASLKLNKGIRDSLGSTLGWVTLGDPNFKVAHRNAWRRSIEPAVAELRNFGVSANQLTDLEALLLKLKTLQWHIRDVAQTPGNNPARVLFGEWIEPSLASVAITIDDLFDRLGHEAAPNAQASQLLYTLRNTLTHSSTLLDNFIRTGDTLLRASFERHNKTIRILNAELADWDLADDTQAQRLRAHLVQELTAFTSLGTRVADVRSSQESNIAHHLLTAKADPIVRQLEVLADAIADDAGSAMREHEIVTRQTVDTALWLLGFLVVATSVVAVVSAVVHGRRIVFPLKALVAGTERLARGDLSTDIAVRSDDEIGHLTRVFNLMRRKLNQNLKLLNYQKAALDEHAIVAITDSSGKITYANEKLCRISQYTREELIGQDHRILDSGHHPRAFFADLWKTIGAGKVWHGEVCNRRKDGTLYWVDMTIVPFTDETDRITQYVAIRTDITERKLHDERLHQAKIAAEAADLAKSEFLANISHEIRTPMTAILGFADELLEEDDIASAPQSRLHAINRIRRNGHGLLDLINDILDLSKIETGKIVVERRDCNPCRVIAEVDSLMRVRADAKGLPFSIEYVGAIPETIQSDPRRLRQILVNLVGNAIKFTEVGAVRLVVRLVPGERNDRPCNGEDKEGLCPSVLYFDVIDTGCGMTEKARSKLFQPFMQADASTTRKFGGTGLGLTISKRFAKMLGGDVTVVASELKVGSTFRASVATGSLDGIVMLADPLSATVVADTAGTVAQVSPSDLRGRRILLAEDGPDNQRLISFVLKKAGADVTIAENGKVALDAALAARDEGNPFDVILMDMQMPVMDGYEATRQLRRKGYTETIVALTAHAMNGDREKCINAGCDDYASKPIDRKKLIDLILEHVNHDQRAVDADLRKYPKTESDDDATKTNNRVKLIDTMQMLIGKRHPDVPSNDNTSDALVSDLADDDMLELVDGFLCELPDRVAAIERALGEQDLVTLETLSHQLRGSAGGYGFPSITDAAGLLESSTKTGEDLERLVEQTRALADLCRRARNEAVQRPGRDNLAQTPAWQTLAPPNGGNGTVLVVDDDPDTRRLFGMLLKNDGFEVHEACDGIEALAMVTDIHPHVILMDVDMPNMDGLECTRKLKADPDVCDIPIIIVSGKTDSRHVRAGLEAGAQEYITKPIQRDEFLLRVRAMHQLGHGEANLLESNAVRGEQARAMGILFDLSRSLAAVEGLDAIAQHAVTATAELFNSRRVSVMLPDDTGQKLFVAGAVGIDDQLAANIRVPVGSDIAGKVFGTGEMVVLNSPSEAVDCTDRYESEFFVSVPLVSKALSVPSKVVGVLNVTERHDLRPFEPHEIEYLDLVCNMTASAIAQFLSDQARQRAHAAIVIGLAKLAEHRDSDTGKHLERVTQYALLLARELRKSSSHAATINDRFLEYLEQSMPLHDIGKVGVPDDILLKPGKLTDAEFAAMKRHSDVGANAIQAMIEQAPEADFLVMAQDIAHSHHEWFDGTGYPRELAGDEIPLAARIAAVADVYDALTTKRPYKEAFPHEKAVAIIRDSSGSHFDPDVVHTLLRIEEDLIDLASKLADGDENLYDTDTARPPAVRLVNEAGLSQTLTYIRA